MSFHFAYPNVLPRKELFIGCGRYTVFPADKMMADEYHEVVGAPNTPNNSTLKRAVQLLAPESFDSDNGIFHKQDKKDVTYQGDSLDLAWFLAHVMRGRQLRCRLETDIWCTGVIQINGSPHILDVDQTGFTLKLKAFLDPVNPDRFFIIPLANLDPAARALCKKNNAEVIRPGSSEDCILGSRRGKRILAVPANGLAELLDIFFLPPSVAQKRGGKTLAAFLSLILFAVFVFVGPPYLMPYLHQWGRLVNEDKTVPLLPAVQKGESETPQPVFHVPQLQKAMESGDITILPDFLKTDLTSEQKELRAFREQLMQPLDIKAVMKYRLEDGSEGSVAFDVHSDKDIPVLTYRDYYRIHIQTENSLGIIYLYLFQVDSNGSLTVIFPSNQFGTHNPLRPWQWPVNIPRGDKWIFLDKLTKSSPQETREILYLLASPWQAKDIEMLSQQLADTPENVSIKAELLNRISLRRQARVPAICCIRWSFFHGR